MQIELRPYGRHGILNGHAGNRLVLWILADPHYLSPSLFDTQADAFRSILAVNSGKLIEHMPEVMEEFLSRALREHPDAVLFPGDLTLNGELAGLLEMGRMFSRLEAEGIRVLVIPGNHDIDCRYASVLTGDVASPAERVTRDAFFREMRRFGYDTAAARDEHSFSWIVPLADDLRILGFDSNTNAFPGGILNETLAWTEKELTRAEAEGAAVITMMHHNLLVQNRFMETGFVLKNRTEVFDLLDHHGVMLNLSGHIHLQHGSRKNSLTDITTASAAVFPLGYSVLEIAEGHREWNYHREYMTQFQDAALRRMYETCERFLQDTLDQLDVSEADRTCMRKAGQEVCVAVFAGWAYRPSDEEAKHGCRLWNERASDTFWGKYIVSAIGQKHMEETI